MLDIRCGGGHLLEELAKAVGPKGKAIRLDTSEDQLKQATKSTNSSMNPGPCSMDYGQWADHPLTIDHCCLVKGCSNPGPRPIYDRTKVGVNLYCSVILMSSIPPQFVLAA